jgi:hypothetical protein
VYRTGLRLCPVTVFSISALTFRIHLPYSFYLLTVILTDTNVVLTVLLAFLNWPAVLSVFCWCS